MDTSIAPTSNPATPLTHSVVLLRTERVARETDVFAFQKPAGFKFKPGQALELSVRDPLHHRGRESRVLSIVSAPYENELVVATRRRESLFKRRLAALPVGACVEIEGPFGSLLLHSNPSRPAVLIAGGIGITPFVSMLRQAANDHRDQVMTLLYSNRHPEDSAFLSELTAYAQENRGRFTLHTVYTGASTGDAGRQGGHRRIDAALIESVIVSPSAPMFYVAGPPAMVAGLRDVLGSMGIQDDDIRSEDFAGY